MTKKKIRQKKSGLLKGILLALNFLALTALFIAYAAPYVNPEKLWIPAFFGLLFPYLVIFNIVFVLIWLLVWKWYLLFSLLALAGGFRQHALYLQFNKPCMDQPVGSPIKILSFNIHNLSQVSQSKLKTPSKEDIYQYIEKESAQLICLQEFTSTGADHLKEIDRLSERLGALYSYHDDYFEGSALKTNAMVTFSAFPICNTGSIRDSRNKAFFIFTDIIMNKMDTVRIYNVHLESVKLHWRDYEFVKDIATPAHLEQDLTQGSFAIFQKLKNAYQRRAGHVAVLSRHILQSPYPVILCGDFNDIPSSYTYRQVKKGLSDSFSESGRGYASTYKSSLPIPFRIDYILADPSFTCCNFTTKKITLSDHYPISVYVHKKGTPHSAK